MTIYDLLFRYGLMIIVPVVALGALIWALTHFSATPGKQVTVLWGLTSYYKKSSDNERMTKGNRPFTLLSPGNNGDLRLVFSSVPRDPSSPEERQHPEFNYLAGPNEVSFAWALYPHLRRLVAQDNRLLPITFSKEMYIHDPIVKSANPQMWDANLLVSGSTKFNDVTRELHAERAELPLNLVFPPEGGAIIDKRQNKRYIPERESLEVKYDYGILARYWNPYEPERYIVFVAGIESIFQIGVTETLLNENSAKRLMTEILAKFGGTLPAYYEILIKAPGRGLQFTGPLIVVDAYTITKQ